MISPLFAVLSAAISHAGCASSHRSLNAAPHGIAQLAWLAGNWIGSEGRISEEHWTKPAGTTMLGVNRTIENDETVFFEYLRIEEQPDGIVYLASPRGQQPPTAFKLIESSPGRAIFENPHHDYPQRIMYWREGDLLHGRIEGRQNGELASESWSWRKVR